VSCCYRFPEHFLWGVATSAYQVEGSPLADGAGESIWHRFSHQPGRVTNGDTGDLACDHYRRYRTDVELMRELGVGAYRFSIAWGRILPEGCGRVNQAGLDFYRRLVETLREAQIEPFVTLYHWDLPAALDDRGGWVNPDVASWFAEYARVVVRALDGDVRLWATLNEPWVIADGGYLRGVLAPGRRDVADAARVSLNLARAHAAAVDVYRAEGRHQVGLVVNLEPKHPASDAQADHEAAARSDAEMNRLYLDMALSGKVPPEVPQALGTAWPGDGLQIAESCQRKIDFLGVNYYTRGVMRDDPAARPYRARRVRQRGALHTATGWEVYPQGMLECLSWVSDRYPGLPVYVTENGAAFSDPPVRGGCVNDPLRVEYLRQHLRAAHQALAAGVDLRGYLAWSLLDNFEWNHGYGKRFGLVHVDNASQQRTLKASARFYSDVIRSNGTSIG